MARRAKDRGIEEIAETRDGWLTALARRDRTRFLNDVFVNPSIGPLAGWVLAILLAILIYIATAYGPENAQRTEDAAPGSGLIPNWVGGWTVIGVTVITFVAAWGPTIRRVIAPGAGDNARAWLAEQTRWMRWPLIVSSAIATTLVRAPSVALSAIDWAFARPLAIAAGARVGLWLPHGWAAIARYGVLFFWTGGGALAAWFAPAPFGLWGAIVGLVAVFATVRRWTWVEQDREAFFMGRGLDPESERIGLGEDLRDEALTAITFLFVLIPLALRQIDLGIDAFDLVDATTGASLPGDPGPLQWIQCFGVELAKTAPFLDWGGVFNIATGSPIVPKSEAGQQLLFGLRATLDLVLLAAVVQGIQIANNLSDQNAAFRRGALPILDPFVERRRFAEVARAMRAYPHVEAARQPSIVRFPRYDRDRLAEITGGAKGLRSATPALRDADARRAALALLTARHPDARTAALLTQSATRDEDVRVRREALEHLTALDLKAAREPALMLLEDQRDTLTRAYAARTLGWIAAGGEDPVTWAALERHLDSPYEPIEVRAHAAVALARIGRLGPQAAIVRELAQALPGGSDALAMALGFAAASADRADAESVAALFAPALRPLARRGAQAALGVSDLLTPVPGGAFAMGSPEGEGRGEERPQHRVTVTAFALGVHPVTFEEYDSFCEATGRAKPSDEGWGRGRRPVINVSWHDAHAYCDWLNVGLGDRVRLPTEAEWEYACRAGATTPFAFGETLSDAQAHFRFDRARPPSGTVEVGAYPANAFGLKDMHGNVWEWCQDTWRDSYAAQDTPNESGSTDRDGGPWLLGDAERRVTRGGSWIDDLRFVRSAARGRSKATFRSPRTGFRIARSL